MTKHLSPAQLAVLLVLGAAILRLLENFSPNLCPGFTPCVALAFVGAAYLPHRWSWLLGVAVILLSEAGFLRWNVQSEGRFFSYFTLISLAFYAAMGGLGALLPRKSLSVLLGGPILGSLFIYMVANTVCWWGSRHLPADLAYPPNFAGWVQANTTGLPGYAPTWTFLRNGILADVVFTIGLIALFEPSLLARPFRSSAGQKLAGPA